MFADGQLTRRIAFSQPGVLRLISASGVLLTTLLLIVLARILLVLSQFAQAVPAAFIFDEDAYYVFAVAHNVAHGRGITADGAQWTNGFQPLWTLIATAPYLLVDDKAALAFVAVLSAALWLTSAFLFARLVLQITNHDAAPSWVPLAAATLFLGDLQLQAAYFNGLETGLSLTLVLALLVFRPRQVRGVRGSLGFGAALGLMVLARNDGVFLAAALLIGMFVVGRSKAALRSCAIAGAAITATLLPWLLYNVWLTGSPVPQSGAATNAGPYAGGSLEGKLDQMVGRVAQLVFTPFPFNYSTIQRLSAPVAGLLAFAALAICVCLIVRHRPATVIGMVRVLWPLGVALVGLCAYYLFASGAVWMYDRYMMPFKLVSLSLWAALVVAVIARARPLAAAAAVLGVVAISFYYQSSATLGSNMTDDLVWLEGSPLAVSGQKVGMFESGRAGYAFPGRVENLDGKTNLAALRAIERGDFLQYLETSDLDVLVFRDYYVPWLDASYPGWQSVFRPEPAGLDNLLISRRVAPHST